MSQVTVVELELPRGVHEVRGEYVERYWTGVLGPSATCLLRRLAWGLESHPDGFLVEHPHLAGGLGLSPARLDHVVERCVRFHVMEREEWTLRAPRRLPPLSERQLQRIPPPLAAGARRL